MPTLYEQVASALKNPRITSAQLTQLISEISDTRNEAREALAAATRRALDPANADPTRERAEAMDHQFEIERLSSAISSLDKRRAIAANHEETAERHRVRADLHQRRDKLARELAKEYPILERRLLDLVTRVSALDAEIMQYNVQLPNGSEFVKSVDETARPDVEILREIGGPDKVACSTIAFLLRLPRFEVDKHAPLSWPRPAPRPQLISRDAS